jgi:4-amino-4-deoxy-L-arabinose transferase-like glycosyltransferase
MGDRSFGDYAKVAWSVIGVALALRVFWAVLVPVVPLSDGQAYDILARTLSEHGVYGWSADRPSAYWPVGTSAIYAFLYTVFGYSFVPIVVLNIALGTAIVGLTIWLARIFFDEKIALLAGWLMAVWPSEVAYVTILASELFFTFFLFVGLVAWFSSKLKMAPRAIVSGLAFGVASYFRPVALLLPIILWMSLVPNWRELRRQLSTLVLAMIFVIAAIAPWSARNTQLFGKFVLISTNGGAALWVGNNPNSTGFYMDTPTLSSELNEYEQGKILSKQAKDYIMAEPVAFVLRSFRKAVQMHLGETIAVHWNSEGIKRRFGESALLPLKLVHQGFWTAVLLLAICGLAIMTRGRGYVGTLTHPIFLTWTYFTAVYAITLVSDRYHFPLHPLISILASLTILTAVRLVQRVSPEVR